MRQRIYVSSFIFDIPLNYYLDILKQYTYHYYFALTEKAPICRTNECKIWLTGLLNDLLSYIEQNPDQPDMDLPFDITSYKITLKS